MNVFVVCFTVSVFILIVSIFSKGAKQAENQRKRLNLIKKSHEIHFDTGLEESFLRRIIIPYSRSVVKSVSNLFPKRKDNKSHEKMNRKLKLAGLEITTNDYNAIRLIIVGSLVIVDVVIMAMMPIEFEIKLLSAIIIALIGLIGPAIFLKIKTNKRQEDLINELPDVMDLLCVAMEAGLGFDAALIKISDRLNGVLVRELSRVHLEINMGKPRRDALRSLAERNPVDELTTFVAAIIQAEKLGVPIKNALVIQAQELRIKRRQQAEEKAMKAPVKMLIPMVVFILPVLFIVILGPSALQIIDQFGGI